MAGSTELISVLVALEFVAMSAIVLLLVPLEVAAPLLLLVFLIALYRYQSWAGSPTSAGPRTQPLTPEPR
jgi:hypothetical protein